jgi:NAD(P)-dependent dehydrogenase (short-subunit alcohol dehydrogenase family)
MARVLITGASKGIGYETALVLARAGHAVVATMRAPEDCDLAEVARREKLTIEIARLDVGDDASVSRLFASGPGAAERLDVLINNAGIYSINAVEDETIVRFAEVMNTNYLGAVRCIKAVLPSMRQRRAGLIINIASIAGRIAAFANGAYAASKFALEAMSESLASEMAAFGVRVVIVEPGIIATPMAVENLPKPEPGSVYPHGERMRAFYAATPVSGPPPSVVADKIADIVAGQASPFRSPVGPDALPFLQLRQGFSDEAWIGLGAIFDNAEFADHFLAVTGVDLRPALGSRGAARTPNPPQGARAR